MLEERKNALEALLFVAGGPLDVRQAAMLLELPPDTVEEIAQRLMDDYAAGGLQIVPVAGGYQMCTRNEVASEIRKKIAPSGSICEIGFKVSRPDHLAVGSPSRYAIQPCATS
jgi:segregation and condensation protein B